MPFHYFMDMHSGGKLTAPPYEGMLIERDCTKDEAIELFKQEMNDDPFRVTCDCCGRNYSHFEVPTFQEAISDIQNWKKLPVDDVRIRIIK